MRARWYCAADDAFLCQACDSSVHSANPLARRHERVRLKTASIKSLDIKNSAPSWHQGFTRKARTPRHAKSVSKKVEGKARNPAPLVPEVGSDENSHEEYEEEQQLLYRVPVFDPFASELCTSTISNEAEAAPTTVVNGGESKVLVGGYGGEGDSCHGFLPSEMDLAEFAADVETLLGRGLENECFGMEELGLVDYKEEETRECSIEKGKVKVEEEDGVHAEVVREHHVDTEIDMTREPFELSFDYDSLATCAEEDEKVEFEEKVVINNGEGEEENRGKKKRKMQLRLDYEAVKTAWANQGCPWTTGSRPDIDADECWPDCMGTCGTATHHPYGYVGGFGGHPAMGDGGREARVSRYREKRRTRLFSKKIRYEVRKLNAEKRPRMKGRFVKRTSFQASAFPLLNKSC
ncbi:zinc finger protein CONSTANS-LIKE 16 [Tripterygium wilfordii]|uniref:Zinc finger protein CONSTANS-LIKE 16 n=2 Tax=Tripterygium wilfordii TaxID=458696 RepID=A0A7J7DGT5_TRIWF|nr:zinc finger protein CONSTANS-LIKE 16 [Tripterygium wilfordii]